MCKQAADPSLNVNKQLKFEFEKYRSGIIKAPSSVQIGHEVNF